jgi:hypothetical protein
MNHWKDLIYFPRLVNRLVALDESLSALYEQCSASSDPDGQGLLDEIEALIGEGFLHCQIYLTHRKGGARAPYACGPRHRSEYFAAVINAAANYCKHEGEWPNESALGSHQARTLRVIRVASVTNSDYPLSTLLYALAPNARLSELIARIVEWREALDKREHASDAQPAHS